MQNDADDVFRGLMDPTRRAILSLLAGDARLTVTQIVAHFPSIGRTAVSAHLRILREADLVTETRDGRNRIYTLGPNRATSALQFLQSVYSSAIDPAAVAETKRPGRPTREQTQARALRLPRAR